ncbi:DUF4974 domain-containing protein [Chitinophaga agrisoli]|uniref:DUF4974 domain-containing protein n=1 Tax=Chitinophaga agrisoli TaxID=2607653 RepID=A0A5B2VJ02_9BACT|nr:FecR domain-containing protein [Chitinophaga agrisoli]KAA2238648.1 DUF4974 domain-containing protein [Chitinophaga agrisoli]
MKEATNNVTDELLAKYLLEEATMAEVEQVRVWLSGPAENQRYFNHFTLIWEQSRELAAHSTVDEAQAWLRLQDRIFAATEARVIRMRQRRRIVYAAAAVLLAAVAGGWWLTRDSSQATKQLALRADDSVVKDTLPDGSRVTLNKHTTLEYKGRKVRLDGEAFFEIAPDERHPFEVIANGDTVQVLGTSFNVCTVKWSTGSDGMVVIVETGSVRVRSGSKIEEVQPGEVVSSDGKGYLQKGPNPDQLYAYYRTHQFICNNTPLGMLVRKLKAVYGIKIIVENRELEHLKINATFEDDSLDQILSVIEKTFPQIHIERHGQQIYIK